MQKLSILIASDSYILTKGLHLLISEIRGSQIFTAVENKDELTISLKENHPHILILTSGFAKNQLIGTNELNRISSFTKTFGIFDNVNAFPDNLMCDKSVNLFDSKEIIINTLLALIEQIQDLDKPEDENMELSIREKDVLKHVAKGMANKEIADKLFISMHTVITHRKNITRKLGIKTISGLTVYAIINGLLGMEDIEK